MKKILSLFIIMVIFIACSENSTEPDLSSFDGIWKCDLWGFTEYVKIETGSGYMIFEDIKYLGKGNDS